jgi:hypothetical protein
LVLQLAGIKSVSQLIQATFELFDGRASLAIIFSQQFMPFRRRTVFAMPDRLS